MALYSRKIGHVIPLSREMRAILRKAAKLSLLRMKGDPCSEISLTLTDNPGIRRLNRDHRGIDRATDVLSFAIREGDAEELAGICLPWEEGRAESVEQVMRHPEIRLGQIAIQGSVRPARLLGDIVISTEQAAKQAVSYGHSYEREMAFLMVHGMLHLLGQDHETETDRAHMEKLQKQILLALGLSR